MSLADGKNLMRTDLSVLPWTSPVLPWTSPVLPWTSPASPSNNTSNDTGDCDVVLCLACDPDDPRKCLQCPNEMPPDADGNCDIDECAPRQDMNDCSEHALCVNTPGSFLCVCHAGFTGDGRTCTDMDECAPRQDMNDCSEHALCVNTPGSFLCMCQEGFAGDGRTCTDMDECKNQNGCTWEQFCINTPGSYRCRCHVADDDIGDVCYQSDLTDYKDCTYYCPYYSVEMRMEVTNYLNLTLTEPHTYADSGYVILKPGEVHPGVCNPSWKSGAGSISNCRTYGDYKLCTRTGEYGPGWKEAKWGKFDNYTNSDGETALVCPQCGCGTALNGRKVSGTATGTVGAVGWNAKGTSVVIVWSVPYSQDFNANQLEMALGKYNYEDTIKSAFKRIHNEEEVGFKRKQFYNKEELSPFKYCNEDLCLFGNMNKKHRALIMVAVVPTVYEYMCETCKEAVSEEQFRRNNEHLSWV